MRLMYTLAEIEKSIVDERVSARKARFDKISLNSILREVKPLPDCSSDEKSLSRSSSIDSFQTNQDFIQTQMLKIAKFGYNLQETQNKNETNAEFYELFGDLMNQQIKKHFKNS